MRPSSPFSRYCSPCESISECALLPGSVLRFFSVGRGRGILIDFDMYVHEYCFHTHTVSQWLGLSTLYMQIFDVVYVTGKREGISFSFLLLQLMLQICFHLFFTTCFSLGFCGIYEILIWGLYIFTKLVWVFEKKFKSTSAQAYPAKLLSTFLILCLQTRDFSYCRRRQLFM